MTTRHQADVADLEVASMMTSAYAMVTMAVERAAYSESQKLREIQSKVFDEYL
jgi:hypothetical protein